MRVAALLAAVAALSACAPSRWTPGGRMTGITTARYVELRPFVTDSVPRSAAVDSSGELITTAEGIVARCVPGFAYCRYLRSTDAVSARPLVQDLDATAWGFGRGLSAHAQLRARGRLGGEADLWPRADDRFDLIAAYVELDRDRVRARGGRQWVASSLGYDEFDGASVLVRASRGVGLEAYGGWSLARALHEPRTSGAISAVEDLPPDDRGVLLGAAVRARPSARLAMAARYQREIRTDRAALYAERVAADAALRLGRGGIDGALAADLAAGDINDASLRLHAPLGRERGWMGGLEASVEGRRFRPFFELWTIWGAFSPVGFDELRGDLRWRGAGDRLEVGARGGWRRYGDTDAAVGFLPLRDDGWRVGADAAWSPTDSWTVHGGYGAEIGFGASRSDQDAGIRWQPGDRYFVGARAMAFQTAYELRVGSGRVLGLGGEAGVRLGTDRRLVADAALYRHTARNIEPWTDWSQRRASVRLEWTVGRDPGMDDAGDGGGR